MRTELRFTRPPSANNCYPTNWATKKRFKSPAYRRWLDVAMQEVMIQPRNEHTGPVKVEYRIRPPGGRADAANYEKPSSDMLVKMRVLKDDSLIRDVRCIWDDTVEGVFATIEDL